MSLDQVPPDYYINDIGQCVIGPSTNCPPGDCTCRKTIAGQLGPKQMFDDRNAGGQCIICLEEVVRLNK